MWRFWPLRFWECKINIDNRNLQYYFYFMEFNLVNVFRAVSIGVVIAGTTTFAVFNPQSIDVLKIRAQSFYYLETIIGGMEKVKKNP